MTSEAVDRNLEVRDAVAFRYRQGAGTDVHLHGRQQQSWHIQGLVTRFPHRDKRVLGLADKARALID